MDQDLWLGKERGDTESVGDALLIEGGLSGGHEVPMAPEKDISRVGDRRLPAESAAAAVIALLRLPARLARPEQLIGTDHGQDWHAVSAPLVEVRRRPVLADAAEHDRVLEARVPAVGTETLRDLGGRYGAGT
jgi:hypothetical protein